MHLGVVFGQGRTRWLPSFCELCSQEVASQAWSMSGGGEGGGIIARHDRAAWLPPRSCVAFLCAFLAAHCAVRWMTGESRTCWGVKMHLIMLQSNPLRPSHPCRRRSAAVWRADPRSSS